MRTVARRPAAYLFTAALALYLGVGLWLALGQGYLLGDALSRVAAAQSVLHSRDPHVAAIGFVFTPLTALAQLPVVALSGWFPGITRWGLSAMLVSAVFMAGACVQVFGIGTDRGLSGRGAVTVAGLFAVHPMIVFYGANGMSEAPFVFLLCWAIRRLIRWTRTDDVHDLLAVGIAFALGYLVRYDALAAAAAGSALVAVVAYVRARRHGRSGVRATAMDLVLVAGPTALAFFGWAAASWLLTGQAFQQFSSAYGNAAIVAQSGAVAPGPTAGLLFAVAETAVLAPALFLLAPLSAALGWRRREAAAAVPLLLCGAVLAFQTLSYISGNTFGFLRFYIAAIPCLAVCIVLLVPARALPPSRRPGRYAAVVVEASAPQLARAFRAGTAMMAAGLAVTVWGMTQPLLAPQEHALAAAVRPTPDDASATNLRRLHILATFSTERAIADHLSTLDLPDGAVLMDTVYGFAVATASARPTQFVIPSDEDFVTILNNPAAHGVRYILTVPPTGRGVSDAVNRRYPTLYDNGAGIATLELQVHNDGADQPTWRIYRVLDSADSATAEGPR